MLLDIKKYWRESISMSHMRFYVFFFFSSRRRHTRFDCDWSSDVCSSDLGGQGPGQVGPVQAQDQVRGPDQFGGGGGQEDAGRVRVQRVRGREDRAVLEVEIGRASCRERV